jgi:hypothetical protein
MASDTSPGGVPTDAKWTVMVFMGADTIEGNAPLLDPAEADLLEMRFVGSGDALNIFVQVHGKGPVPRRGRITEGMPEGIDALDYVPEGERNTARGMALESFIRWSLMTAGHNPMNPNHYSLLVLWGHAYDFAIDRAKTPEGTIDPLSFAELTGVLKHLQAQFGAAGDAKLDILGFDACDLSIVEMAYQLQPFAKYLLSSQIGIPIPGWPYDRILDRLRNPIGRLMVPAEFGSYVVRRFCESYVAAARTVSLTLLDLDRAHELAAGAEALALTLASAIDDLDTRDRIAYLFSQSQTAAGKPYVDVADLCLNLVRKSGDVLIIEAARALGDFLISPQFPLVGRSAEGAGRPFVVEHGRNAGQTARLNGISIYAPHVAPDYDFDAVRHLYQNFAFAQETYWSRLVHSLARLS